jgi:hypothetical protein
MPQSYQNSRPIAHHPVSHCSIRHPQHALTHLTVGHGPYPASMIQSPAHTAPPWGVPPQVPFGYPVEPNHPGLGGFAPPVPLHPAYIGYNLSAAGPAIAPAAHTRELHPAFLHDSGASSSAVSSGAPGAGGFSIHNVRDQGGSKASPRVSDNVAEMKKRQQEAVNSVSASPMQHVDSGMRNLDNMKKDESRPLELPPLYSPA